MNHFISQSRWGFPIRWLKALFRVSRTSAQMREAFAMIADLQQQHQELQQTLLAERQERQQTTQQLSQEILELQPLRCLILHYEHDFSWKMDAPDWLGNAQKKIGVPFEHLTTAEKNEAFYSYYSEISGGHDEILQQQYEIYLSLITKNSELPFLDIGCGAGEFLTFLKKYDIMSIGIDLSETEVSRATKAGLHVQRAQANTYLNNTLTSFSGISLLQVIEHLPPEEVLTTLQVCADKLCSKGILIVETINMRHPLACNGFYTDPTHQKPLSDTYLAFLFQWIGLERVQIIYNLPQPVFGVANHEHTRIYDNFTVIGYKPDTLKLEH